MTNSWFTHGIRVRWRDGDSLGHVNNAVYLTYLEEARDALLSEAFNEDPPSYVLVRAEIDFERELTLATRDIEVRISPEKLGTTSIVFAERVMAPDATIHARARSTVVRWNAATRRAQPLSAAEREFLTRLAPNT